MKGFKSLWRDIKQLPSSEKQDQYDVVMGFHPYTSSQANQSPEVAGYQMTRILARTTSLETHFCNISRYAGVALPLYNLLRHFDLIDEDDVLLEHLCDVVDHNIFRGPHLTLNLFSPYAAFQGMALMYDKKKRTYGVGLSDIAKRQLHPHGISVMTGLIDSGFKPYCN